MKLKTRLFLWSTLLFLLIGFQLLSSTLSSIELRDILVLVCYTTSIPVIIIGMIDISMHYKDIEDSFIKLFDIEPKYYLYYSTVFIQDNTLYKPRVLKHCDSPLEALDYLQEQYEQNLPSDYHKYEQEEYDYIS